ncbi:hypothetical protein MKW94_030356 [Papaver nudicaule]|uniref:Uncharacterized protein n=1 Tax=Papaver nudicaule TaxID=74823 RepID=A0AA41RWK2_PAPNU|nr:hypothetical protein [Papaver nudicaule]
MVLAHQQNQEDVSQCIQKTKTLICALNLVSRNLPLPQDIFDTVNSIYSPDNDDDDDLQKEKDAGNSSSQENGILNGGDLIAEFEDALVKQRPNCVSGLGLRKSAEVRLKSNIQHRLSELEELPSSRGEDLQMKCLLELYVLKLADLQIKVRSDVSSEYWLAERCAYPDKQLFDWGLMRLPSPAMYGIGDAFAMEAGDRQRKKRDAESVSRLEEEEKSRTEIRKRRFFAEVRDASREFDLQAQAVLKRRKLRNDQVQACPFLLVSYHVLYLQLND